MGTRRISILKMRANVPGKVITAIKDGRDTAGPQSFAAVSDEWFKRHATGSSARRRLEVISLGTFYRNGVVEILSCPSR